MKIIRSDERGTTEIGWLKSKHSFSFGDYYNPDQMGYRSLRVINDDFIAAGEGFGTHGHKDMEIISVVTEGALAHKDSMGNGETLRPGEVQVMSAGRGIQHSEFNPSQTERAHLFQIWIMPETRGLIPSYGQKAFETEARTNKLLRVAGPKRAVDDGALKINQDADLFLVRVEPGKSVQYHLDAGRGAWIHLMDGAGKINGNEVNSGDAASIEGLYEIVLTADQSAAEFLVFDLK